MDMELLTAEECNLIQMVNFMSKPRPSSPIRWGPDKIATGPYEISRQSFFELEVGAIPKIIVKKDGNEIGTGLEIISSILERVGGHDLENRMNFILQKAKYDLWGGEEEYYKIFFWLKDGKNHSDLDSVDNVCFDCGIRGIPQGQSLCAACSIAR